MKRKVLMMIFAVNIALAGCSGGRKTQPDPDTSSGQVEEPAEIFGPQLPEEPVENEDPEPVEEAEEEPPQTYVEEHGLEFCQDTSLTLQAVRYNGDDDMSYDFIDEQLKLESIRIEPSETEGYQTVIIDSSVSGDAWRNGIEDKNHLSLKRFVLCEMYTGRIIPGAATEDDMQIEYGMEVEWEGENYHIGYTENTEWEWSDWEEVDTGIWNEKGTMHVTCKVTVPEGYDGLMLWAAPKREWDGRNDNAGVVDETEVYLFDEWKDGDYLIRVSDMYEILNNTPVEE